MDLCCFLGVKKLASKLSAAEDPDDAALFLISDAVIEVIEIPDDFVETTGANVCGRAI